MIVFAFAAAFLTRVLFALHVFVSLGLFILHTQQPFYWCFLTGILFVFIEMLYVMVKRKGKEYKFFWPSCFLYLAAMLPVIWIMELDLLQHRLNKRDQLITKLNNSSSIKIRGIDIKAVFNSDVAAKKVCELGVVIFIILGRWLLPRGQLTRDQLSALLLGYIGMGADILDLFTSLSHDNVSYNTDVHYVTLVVFSWSMLQFCITATVTAGDDDTGNRMEVVAEIEKTRRSSDTENGAPQSFTNPVASVSDQEEPSGTKSEVDRSSTASDKTPRRRFNLSADILQIMVPLLMQDGPFLILRLVLLIEFSVSSETHIYFTGKNILTVVLLLYRLYGLKLATEYPIPGGPRGSLSVALASDVSVPIDEITVQDDAVKHEVMVHQDIEVFELDETEESKDDSNQSGIQQSSALDPDHTTDLVL